MKKLLFLIVLFLSVVCHAQTDVNSNKNQVNTNNTSSSTKFIEIDVDINNSIFVHQKDNSYFTENEESAMQTMLIPMSFETMKINMQKKKILLTKEL